MKCVRNFGLIWLFIPTIDRGIRLTIVICLWLINQMKPSSINPNVTNEEFYDAELFQGLHENEEYCPEGTIPIKHAREDEYYANRAIPPAARRKNLNIRVNYDTNGHEVYHIIKPLLFSHALISSQTNFKLGLFDLLINFFFSF
jgi:hypothetical protein